LKKIGENGKTSFDALRTAANSIGPVMSGVGKAFISINQGLEVAKKAFGAFNMVVIGAIEKSMEYRSANDEARKKFEAWGESVDQVKKSLGDALLPVMQSIIDSLGGASSGVKGWIQQNRVLIGLKLVEWLGSIAKTLVSGVAGALLGVVKIWYGWQEAIVVVRSGIEAFFGFLLKGISGAMTALAKVAGVFDKDLAASIRGASVGVEDFGNEFLISANDGVEATEKLVAEQESLENKIKDVADAATKTGGAIDAAMQRAAAAVRKAKPSGDTKVKTAEGGGGGDKPPVAPEENKNLETQEQLYVRINQQISNKYDMMDYIALNAAKASDAEIAAEEAYQAQLDETQRKQEELADSARAAGATAIGVANDVGDAFGEQMALMVTENQTLEESMKNLAVSAADSILNMVQQAIMGYAAAAAGAAFLSQAAIPVIGPILGAAAAAAAFGFVRAYIKKFEKGGVVQGGIPGVDSVPILAQQGERVLTPKQTQGFDRLVNDIGKNKGKNVNGSVINFAPKIDMLSKGTKDEEKIMLLRLGRSLEELVRDGQLRFA
jgi:hypothetical protein